MTWLAPQLWLRPHVQSMAATLIGRCRQNRFTTLLFTLWSIGAAVFMTFGAGEAGASAAGADHAGSPAADAGSTHALKRAKVVKDIAVRFPIIMDLTP
jgi:hypothetical protein